jgi:hypothetical protein
VVSNAYSAELQVDPALRRLVTGSGLLLLLAGVAAIFTLPVPPPQRAGAALLWSAWSGWGMWRLIGRWRTYVALRVSADGSVRLRRSDGEWREATLLPGSILLQDWGWIRLRTHGGAAFAEPCRAGRQDRRDWRRLQVLWRHIGAPV